MLLNSRRHRVIELTQEAVPFFFKAFIAAGGIRNRLEDWPALIGNVDQPGKRFLQQEHRIALAFEPRLRDLEDVSLQPAQKGFGKVVKIAEILVER